MKRTHIHNLAYVLMLAAYLILAPAQHSAADPSIPLVPTPAAPAMVEAVIRADTSANYGSDLYPKEVFYLNLYVFTSDEAQHPMNAIVRITGPLRVQGVSAVSNGWNGEGCTIQTTEADERKGLTVLTCHFTPSFSRPQSVYMAVNVPPCYSTVPGQPNIRASVHVSDEAGNFAGAQEYMRVTGGTQECLQYMPLMYGQPGNTKRP